MKITKQMVAGIYVRKSQPTTGNKTTEQKPDNRPENLRHWRIDTGSAIYDYKMGLNGAVKMQRLGEHKVHTYSPAELVALHHAHLEAQAQQKQSDAKPIVRPEHKEGLPPRPEAGPVQKSQDLSEILKAALYGPKRQKATEMPIKKSQQTLTFQGKPFNKRKRLAETVRKIETNPDVMSKPGVAAKVKQARRLLNEEPGEIVKRAFWRRIPMGKLHKFIKGGDAA